MKRCIGKDGTIDGYERIRNKPFWYLCDITEMRLKNELQRCAFCHDWKNVRICNYEHGEKTYLIWIGVNMQGHSGKVLR